MMKLMKINKPLLTATLLTSLLATSVFAHGDFDEDGSSNRQNMHRQQHRGGFDRAFEKLDLTEQQKATLTSMHEENRSAHEAKMNLRLQNREQMKTLLSAELLDESAIKDLSQQIALERAENMIAQVNQKREAMAVLNDAQRVKFEQMKQKREQRKERKYSNED